MNKFYMNGKLIHKASDHNTKRCEVEKWVFLPHSDFERQKANPYQEHEAISASKELMYEEKNAYHCIMLLDEYGDDGLLIEADGFDYPRYSMFVPDAKSIYERYRTSEPELKLHDMIKDTVEKIAELAHTGKTDFISADMIDMDEVKSLVKNAIVQQLVQRDDIKVAENTDIGVDFQPDIHVEAEELTELKFYCPLTLIINAVDSIISLDSNNDNILAIEQAYELEAKCYNKLNKKGDADNCNLELAQYYYDFAERVLQKDAMGAFRSVDFFEKAIILFRNNGATSKAESVHKKLIEVQKKIPNNMQTFRTTFDVSKVIENINTNMDGLSFEECIIRFTQYVSFETIDTIKKRTIKECTSNPLSSLFGTNVLDAQGRTIIKMSPLDDKNPEKDQALLELHMFRSSLQTQRIVGDIWLKNILHYIRSRFSINNEMVDFLTKENCIIPEGRETIFQKGIGCFLRGEYYEAMHILAPQMENLFRNIANEVGGLTSTLSDDGVAQEKVLSSVFSLPELLDAYDNNIIFAFRGLLNEQAGANIRNRIAHGIIEEAECSSGECLYFGALVIKLLSFTAWACIDIINNSDKIKDFKFPTKDAIRIVK